MPCPRFHLFLVTLCAWLTLTAVAQQAPSQLTATRFTVDNDFVQKQFGTSCTLLAGPQPLMADLDGDGVEDIVIPARCTNPMMDQAENSFKVVDPYDSFFGYGNPTVTTRFASEDPDLRGLALLIIHGVGPEAWHSATPKAKFVIINLPFKQVSVKKLGLRKRSVLAIYAEESGSDQTTSATFWDGKKYKYQPMGSSME
jgi:hypothetical protein